MAYPYYQNYNPFLPNQNSVIQNQNSGNPNNSMIWVQGEAGAKAYLVAPNSTVQLWDSESPTIYLKSADATGMPTIKILDYKERNAVHADVSKKQPQTDIFATKEDISALRSEIEELRDKIKPKKTIKKGEKDE